MNINGVAVCVGIGLYDEIFQECPGGIMYLTPAVPYIPILFVCLHEPDC